MASKIDISPAVTSQLTELEWINLLADMERDLPTQETMTSKMKRKTLEQPLIPVGMFNTHSLQFNLYQFHIVIRCIGNYHMFGMRTLGNEKG